MYIADLISKDIEAWNPGDIILIDAPTGSGKTTAVLHTMRREALKRRKEILYISNRKMLSHQIKSMLGSEIGWGEDDDRLYDVERFDGITVVSYQKIQNKVKNGKTIGLDDYCFVVFDEFHYLLSDAMFQPDIIYFLQWLERCNSLKAKTMVLISATPTETFEFLKEKTKFFACCKEGGYTQVLRKDLYSHITTMSEVALYQKKRVRLFWQYRITQENSAVIPYFFNEEENIVELIKADQSNEKWMIFIAQKAVGKRMYEQIAKTLGEDNVLFLSAAEVENDNELIEEIVRQQSFSQKVLITTKVLENGVSIHDDTLKNIVISTVWHDEFLQMIGRKRMEAGEKIKVYINLKSLNSFNGIRNKVLLPLYNYVKVHPAERMEKILHDDGYYQFAKRFLVFDVEKKFYKINPAGKYVLKRRLDFVDRMLTEFQRDDKAFIKEVMRWLSLETIDLEPVIIEEMFEKQHAISFERYLKDRCGKKLGKREQMELRDYFSQLFATQLHLKREKPGLKIINHFLHKNTKYCIRPNYNSGVAIWQIVERG